MRSKRINNNQLANFVYKKCIRILDRLILFEVIEVVQDITWAVARLGVGLPMKFFDFERDYLYNTLGTFNAILLLNAYQNGSSIENIRLVKTYHDLKQGLRKEPWVLKWLSDLECDNHILSRLARRMKIADYSSKKDNNQVMLDKAILTKTALRSILSRLLGNRKLPKIDEDSFDVFDGYYLYSIGHYAPLDTLIKTAIKNSSKGVYIFASERLCLLPSALRLIEHLNPSALVLVDPFPYICLSAWKTWITNNMGNKVFLTENGNYEAVNGYQISPQIVTNSEKSLLEAVVDCDSESLVCIHLRERTFKGWDSIRNSRDPASYDELYAFLLERYSKIVFLGNNIYNGRHSGDQRILNAAEITRLTYDMQLTILKAASICIGSLSGPTHLTTLTGTPCIYIDAPYFGNVIMPPHSRHLAKIPCDRELTSIDEISPEELKACYNILMNHSLEELYQSGDVPSRYKLSRSFILNNTPIDLIIRAVELMKIEIPLQSVDYSRYMRYRLENNQTTYLNEIGVGVVDYKHL